MAKSKRIKASDVQQMLHLIGECRELGDDAVIWRSHFMAGVAALVDADAAAGAEAYNCLDGKLSFPGAALWGFEHGFNPEGLRIIWSWNDIDPAMSLLWVKVRDHLRANPHGATVARQQMLTDRQWHESPDYQIAMRTMGSDAVIHSFHQLPRGGDAFDGLFWVRLEGRPTFDEREVALVTLIHEEATRLIGGPLASFDEPRPSQLPGRARQVLRRLLDGDADKQIAARLNLSAHTVNQYTKRIYRHFSVNGRMELLARWIRRGWGCSAAWDSGNGADGFLSYASTPPTPPTPYLADSG